MAIPLPELRANNWYEQNGQRYKMFIPDAGYPMLMAVDRSGPLKEINYKDLTAVPLTSKVLQCCGFKRRLDESGQFYHWELTLNHGIAPHGSNNYVFAGIELIENGDAIPISFTVNEFWASRSIRHLHQLQNLYFDLTGSELTVNLGTTVEAS